MDCMEHIELIKTDFVKCRQILLAIGDENRQNIIASLMGTSCTGLRVGEITAMTHLSRPAVSHHMKILLDCGIVSRRKQGTMNFYALNTGDELQNLFALVKHLEKFIKARDEI